MIGKQDDDLIDPAEIHSSESKCDQIGGKQVMWNRKPRKFSRKRSRLLRFPDRLKEDLRRVIQGGNRRHSGRKCGAATSPLRTSRSMEEKKGTADKKETPDQSPLCSWNARNLKCLSPRVTSSLLPEYEQLCTSLSITDSLRPATPKQASFNVSLTKTRRTKEDSSERMRTRPLNKT